MTEKLPTDTSELTKLNPLLTGGIAPTDPPLGCKQALRQRLLARVSKSLAEHAGLLTVRRENGNWRRIAPRIRIKPLWDKPRGNSVLIELSPGVTLPIHRYLWDEEGIVLEGEVQIGRQVLCPLNYQVSLAGSRHAPIRSPEGFGLPMQNLLGSSRFPHPKVGRRDLAVTRGIRAHRLGRCRRMDKVSPRGRKKGVVVGRKVRLLLLPPGCREPARGSPPSGRRRVPDAGRRTAPGRCSVARGRLSAGAVGKPPRCDPRLRLRPGPRLRLRRGSSGKPEKYSCRRKLAAGPGRFQPRHRGVPVDPDPDAFALDSQSSALFLRLEGAYRGFLNRARDWTGLVFRPDLSQLHHPFGDFG